MAEISFVQAAFLLLYLPLAWQLAPQLQSGFEVCLTESQGWEMKSPLFISEG